VLAVWFAALLAWSWRKWADPHIDFGAELYIAWQIAEGRSLYTDIAYRHGPLSHHANGLLFAVFGASVRTLVIANLAVLAAICAMLWRLFELACDRFTATAAVGVMLAVFAFGQHAGIANFNYVTPYLHAQTHGLALSLLLLLALLRAARTGARLPLAVAGACLGAVFLTKAELFVPALGAVAAAFAARARGAWATPGRAVPSRWGADAAVLSAAALVPIGGFAGLLVSRMPADIALRGLLGNWAHLSGTLSDPFYLAGAGLGDTTGNASRAAAALAAVLAVAALAVASDRAAARARRPAWVGAGIAALVTGGLVAASARVPWLELARALPFTSLAAAIAAGHAVLRRGADPHARRRVLPVFLVSVYALLLIAKLGLAARFHHYGFVLAVPATLLLVAAGTHALPAALRARGGTGGAARLVCSGVAAATCAGVLAHAQPFYAAKRLELGRGADAILAEVPAASPRPLRIAETLAFLEARMRPGDTLVVMPEGVMLNYLLRKENPTPYTLFVPTEIRTFGETAMLAALEAHPPDYVVLAHRRSGEFGVGPFGRDPRNGAGLRRWVDARYREVARFGPEPFTGAGFGTLVLERSARPGHR
jgi:hypothetical protein